MKKLVAIALVLCLALSLVACGGSAAKVASLDDLSKEGMKIGVQQGTTGDIYACGDYGEENVEKYSKGADAVQALLTGKINAVIIDNGPASVFVEKNASKLGLLDEDFAVEDYAICISKDTPELTAAFNEAIAEIQSNGTLDAIMDKYINGVDGAPGYVTPAGTQYPNGTLTMATNAFFPPYEYYEGEDIIGVDAEFAKAICDMLGYELKIEDMEFDSIIPAVQSGKADFGAAGMTVTEDRLKSIDFTDSFCTGIQSVIVMK